MPFPFTSRSSSSSATVRSSSKWHLLRKVAQDSSPTVVSWDSLMPQAITEQISTEIYELIIDHLRDDKPSLLACNLVCRSWAPRSRCLLLELMVCRPVPMASHGGFGRILSAVPYRQGPNDELIYGTTDGVYRASKDGTRLRLLSLLCPVSQIEILPDANLFLCLSDGVFMSISLTALNAGTCRNSDIIRLSKHASFFDVYRGKTAGESHRVCVLKSSALSCTIKVFDVSGNQQVSTLVVARELYIPREANYVRFTSRERLVAALKKGPSVEGGFELVDLTTLGTQALLDPNDPALRFAKKKIKPMAVHRVSNVFLMCYDKCGFYIDRTGAMTRNELLMRWKSPALAFVLHESYLLVFSDLRVEIWNIETAERVQQIHSPYHLLNAPDSEGKILAFSSASEEMVEMVFHGQGL